MRGPLSAILVVALSSQLGMPSARADDIQITPVRQAEGVSKTDVIRVADPKLGLGMPSPSADGWSSFFQGFFRTTPDTPAGVTFYQSDSAGFALNFAKPHGKGFDWYKLVYDKVQTSTQGNYKVELVLVAAACDPPVFAVVETDRFSADGKLVSKTVYPLAKQKFQPIMDDSGRFDAGNRTDPYLLLILQAGTCNSMAE